MKEKLKSQATTIMNQNERIRDVEQKCHAMQSRLVNQIDELKNAGVTMDKSNKVVLETDDLVKDLNTKIQGLEEKLRIHEGVANTVS